MSVVVDVFRGSSTGKLGPRLLAGPCAWGSHGESLE